MSRILVRDSILKGQGVVASFADGTSAILAGNQAAPPDSEYNPFFHNPNTGTVRDDIEHKFPLEALSEQMARDFIDSKAIHPQQALSVAQGMINCGHSRFNDNHHDEAHHLEPAFDEIGNLNPIYAATTSSQQYQGKKLRSHERQTKTPDGMPINYWQSAAPHPEFGHSIESAALHAWREIEQCLEEQGLGEATSAIRGSHIEPGSMTNGAVYRHTSLGPGPGDHVTRPMNEMMNQTRGLPSADPVNILFDEAGKPRLPPAFWQHHKGGAGPAKVKTALAEQFGIEDPETLSAMASSAVGQLLVGTGRRTGGKVDRLMRELGERLDIEGENADLFARAQSHIQRSTAWKGRAAKAAVNLAAMMRVADATGDDLQDFGDWSKVSPGVIDAWKQVAPMVGEQRGGAAEGHDWGAPIPENTHPSAALPSMPAISEGPPIHELAPLQPRAQTPLPPRQIPEQRGVTVPPEAEQPPAAVPHQWGPVPAPTHFLRSDDDPTSRILFAMEEMQLAAAREDDSILKHLPTKRDLRVQNDSDVALLAQRLGITGSDVRGLYSAGGDWLRVAKAFQVDPSVVGVVKVALS